MQDGLLQDDVSLLLPCKKLFQVLNAHSMPQAEVFSCECNMCHWEIAILCASAVALQAVLLGVSCYFDVQDMMEKRVRSRFSNRKIFLPGLAEQKVCHSVQIYQSPVHSDWLVENLSEARSLQNPNLSLLPKSLTPTAGCSHAGQ